MQQQFEGGVYRDQHTHAYLASVTMPINWFLHTHIMCMLSFIIQGEFEGGIYTGMKWQEPWQYFEWWDFKVQRDFSEMPNVRIVKF